MDECINKIWYTYKIYIYNGMCVYTVEYMYTHTETHNGKSCSLRKEELSDTCYKWVNLETIKQS